MEFEEIFQHIGEFGIYQFWLFLALGVFSLYSGLQNMGMAILGKQQRLMTSHVIGGLRVNVLIYNFDSTRVYPINFALSWFPSSYSS